MCVYLPSKNTHSRICSHNVWVRNYTWSRKFIFNSLKSVVLILYKVNSDDSYNISASRKIKKKYTSISNFDDVSNSLSTIALNPAYVDNLNLLTFPRHIWPTYGFSNQNEIKYTAVPESDQYYIFSNTLHIFSGKMFLWLRKDNMLKQRAFCLLQNQMVSNNISNLTKGSFLISEKVTSLLHS
jgi:hypothetical protein